MDADAPAPSPLPSTGADVAVIGGGPAGLIAAETLAAAGRPVTLYERKPSPARKLLLAGRGGLNLTHSEALPSFMTRYGAAAPWLSPAITAFPPDALRHWCAGLGIPTFVGSSGRVFPEELKASPLVRAWLARLEGMGVRLLTGHEWQGWDDTGRLAFMTPDGETRYARPAATLLALGGASWPRMGSDGAWAGLLREHGVSPEPFRPTNCGFAVAWSDAFRQRFAGQPLKSVALSGAGRTIRGEAMICAQGIEGGGIYALSAALRGEIEKRGQAVLTLDLKPALTPDALTRRLSAPRGRNSFSNHLRKAAGLPSVAAGLLRESAGPDDPASWPAQQVAARLKALPLILTAPFPLERAISSAGGVGQDQCDERFMLRALPGVFAAGEMLDWEAPTGGYLLQASFATGIAAARGILGWLAKTGQAGAPGQPPA